MTEHAPTPQPSPAREEGGNGGNKSVRRALRVMKHLGTGDILAWRSMRQIAKDLEMTESQAYTALEELVREDLVEKSAHGYRQSADGLAYFALAAREAVSRAVYQAGFRK